MFLQLLRQESLSQGVKIHKHIHTLALTAGPLCFATSAEQEPEKKRGRGGCVVASLLSNCIPAVRTKLH